MNILASLQALADADYKKFHSGLIPTVPQEKILGVRTPALRQLAKKLHGTAEAESFYGPCLMSIMMKINYTPSCFRIYLITLFACRRWSSFYLMLIIGQPAILSNPKFYVMIYRGFCLFIKKCLHSDEEFTIRRGLNLLMSYYLDTAFTNEYLEWVVEVKSDKYYVKMMQAWFFATALAKQYDASVVYLKEHKLSAWVQQKTIQKACESYRISSAEKAYLRTLRDK